MKRLTSESKFGLEYLWDEVITPANDNGVQCIVDDNADGSIYLYDPIKKQWATSQTLREFRVDVTDAIVDRDTYGQAWLDCRDPEFRDFAIKWDELQKKSDADNVYKTKKCELIRLAANEATRSDGDMDDNVSEWYADRFPDDDLAGRINKQVTFQDVMDCIDYGTDIYDLLETFDSTIRERLFAELAARTGIEYGKLYRKWLKNSAFDESIDNMNEVELWDSDFDQLNKYLEDMAQSYWEEDNMGGGGKAEMLTNLYSDVLQWLNDRGLTKHNHSPITLVVDGAQIPARDLASNILDRIYKQNADDYTGYGESTGKPSMSLEQFVEELSRFPRNVFVSDGMNGEYGENVVSYGVYKDKKVVDFDLYDKYYGKPFQSTLKVGQILDALERDIDDFSGWTVTVDNKPVDSVHEGKFSDTIIIDHAASGVVGESFDDSDDWSATEDEVEVQWMIDDKELGIESGSTETVVIDIGLVDSFEELVQQVELALEKAHNGMMFDYDDEWIFVDEDNLLKRFGYNMNESGSNGGVIDVTLKFTNGHYGKKLKAGDERTIKLDTSTAPTIYDQDDMLTWIAEVASDQIPGGGCFTKYSFETIDPPDDVLIKAVMGDEGFGPDVDIDFEDFKPEDVPSEISYKDALKFYKKMHDAYDDRKLDYTKYDKIRNKLMAAIVKGLLKEKSLDELAKEWFINYGTMNGWGWKTSFKYNVACALHEIHKKKHPDEHVVDREDTMRGWHSEKCSCGLASSCDSSD